VLPTRNYSNTDTDDAQMSETHEEAMLKANRLAAEHGIDLSKLPQTLDMSAENITENVHAMNANCE
jgi:hypothetical protein